MNIKLRTEDALKNLVKNKEAHINEYTMQIQGWKKAMSKFSEELAKWRDDTPENIEEAEKYNTKRPLDPLKPEVYVADYNRLIELLENHVEDTIEVSEYEFNQIVKDEFGWKGAFLANSSTYSSR